MDAGSLAQMSANNFASHNGLPMPSGGLASRRGGQNIKPLSFDAIKQGNAVFAFTLKNKAGETESWHIDLKESGKVATGTGAKPTGTF